MLLEGKEPVKRKKLKLLETEKKTDRTGFQRRQVSHEKGKTSKMAQRDRPLETRSRKDGEIHV